MSGEKTRRTRADHLQDLTQGYERTLDILRAEDFKNHPVGGIEVVATARMEQRDSLLAVARRWLRIMGDAGADRCGCRPKESYVCCRCEVVAAIAKAEGKS